MIPILNFCPEVSHIISESPNHSQLINAINDSPSPFKERHTQHNLPKAQPAAQGEPTIASTYKKTFKPQLQSESHDGLLMKPGIEEHLYSDGIFEIRQDDKEYTHLEFLQNNRVQRHGVGGGEMHFHLNPPLLVSTERDRMFNSSPISEKSNEQDVKETEIEIEIADEHSPQYPQNESYYKSDCLPPELNSLTLRKPSSGSPRNVNVVNKTHHIKHLHKLNKDIYPNNTFGSGRYTDGNRIKKNEGGYFVEREVKSLESQVKEENQEDVLTEEIHGLEKLTIVKESLFKKHENLMKEDEEGLIFEGEEEKKSKNPVRHPTADLTGGKVNLRMGVIEKKKSAPPGSKLFYHQQNKNVKSPLVRLRGEITFKSLIKGEQSFSAMSPEVSLRELQSPFQHYQKKLTPDHQTLSNNPKKTPQILSCIFKV
jgi:hypothetical protein